MKKFKAVLTEQKKNINEEFNTQNVKDEFYSVSDGVMGIEDLIKEIQAIPDDVAEKNGINKSKEIKNFKDIYKLMSKSELGGMVMKFKELFTEAPSSKIMLKNLIKKLDARKARYTIEDKINHTNVLIGKYIISVGGEYAGKYTLIEKIGDNRNEKGSFEWDNILKMFGEIY